MRVLTVLLETIYDFSVTMKVPMNEKLSDQSDGIVGIGISIVGKRNGARFPMHVYEMRHEFSL